MGDSRYYSELRKAIRRFIASPDGKVIMDYLKSQYGEVHINTSNPTSMAADVGAMNVYNDILILAREENKNVQDEE